MMSCSPSIYFLFCQANSPLPVWAFSGLFSPLFVICYSPHLLYLHFLFALFFGANSMDARGERLSRGILDPLRTGPDSASVAEQV